MPARSQAQQRFMGMVHAEKEGTLDKSKLDPEFAAKIERVAASIKAKQARDFAETKHKGLPKKVKKKGMKKKAYNLRGYNIPRVDENSDYLYRHEIQDTPGIGAWFERKIKGGETGKHYRPKQNERFREKPGITGFFQRVVPGGDTGYEYERITQWNKFKKP